MNEEEAEEFFTNLEATMKDDNFVIPRRKGNVEAGHHKSILGKAESESPSPKKQYDMEGKNRKRNASSSRSPNKNKMTKKEHFTGVVVNDPIGDPLGLNENQPKTYGQMQKNRVLDCWMDLYDAPLPEELVAMCTLNECQICDIKVTSAIVSKTHYVGKPHLKKVDKYLAEWAAKTGNVPPKKKPQQSIALDYDSLESVNQKYCTACQLELSSEIVAIAHYKGKNHAKQLRKIENGTAKTSIGDAFSNDISSKLSEIRNNESSSFTNLATDSETDGAKRHGFYCLPCQMGVDNLEAYNDHLNSTDHKLRAMRSETVTNNPGIGVRTAMSIDDITCKDCKLNFNSPKAKEIHVSNHGIVQGWYCKACKLNLQGPIPLQAHIEGKSHRNKLQLYLSYMEDGEKTVNPFYCGVCQVVTNCNDALQAHIKGKKHLKRVANLPKNN